MTFSPFIIEISSRQSDEFIFVTFIRDYMQFNSVCKHILKYGVLHRHRLSFKAPSYKGKNALK